MYTYVAYGLGIHSALPLPELVASAAVGADVVIQIGKLDGPLPEPPHTGSDFHVTSEGAYFFWEQVGAFLVRDGKEITVEPFPGVEERLIRLPLLGMVLAALLHQRGLLVLHASTVAINGSAVAFLGKKGWGKSTIAAALHAHGHRVVVDDMLAIDVAATESPMVHPGFPQLKLWPDVVASLGDDPETLDRLHSQVEKRARSVTAGFSQTPLPLKRIYVLDAGPAREIETLRAHEAFIELVRHSYFAGSFQAVDAVSSHFRKCVSLTRRVPMGRLKRQGSLSTLPALARLVEEHLARDG